jgi:hypothetical protein
VVNRIRGYYRELARPNAPAEIWQEAGIMWVVMSTAAEHEKFRADAHVAVLNIQDKGQAKAQNVQIRTTPVLISSGRTTAPNQADTCAPDTDQRAATDRDITPCPPRWGHS